MRSVRPVVLFAVGGICSIAAGQTRPNNIPALNSRPGAAYTIYVNMGGFDFSSEWHGSGKTPGYTPPVNYGYNDVAPSAFNPTELSQIKVIWAGIANAYVGFNVNVTTVDPYNSLNDPTPTDAERVDYYDSLPNFMHTVVGSQERDNGSGGVVKWFSPDADGVSPGIGCVAGTGGDLVHGDHTNWMFSEAQAGAYTSHVIHGGYIGAVAAHENAHSFGLYHQGDWRGSTRVNEYGLGDDTSGAGSYVPIIGQADGRQRIAWRVGDTHPNDVQTIQNDVGRMITVDSVATASGLGRTGAANLALIDDGIGKTLATATPLPVVGNQINLTSPSGKGVIVPTTGANPDPMGIDNYTKDWFSFYTDGGDAVSLTLNNGTDFLVPGVVDDCGGTGTLRSKLNIYNALGVLIGTAVEDPSTLLSTYSALLSAGTYYAQVTSFGGHQQTLAAVDPYNPAQYFDMGAFFLSGSGMDIPEPSLFGVMVLTISFRRRNAAGLRDA